VVRLNALNPSKEGFIQAGRRHPLPDSEMGKSSHWQNGFQKDTLQPRSRRDKPWPSPAQRHSSILGLTSQSAYFQRVSARIGPGELPWGTFGFAYSGALTPSCRRWRISRALEGLASCHGR
jgi:hypothetical protein